MIPIIGLMIGTYIFTRMLELYTGKETGALVKVCALVTIVIILFCIATLFLAGARLDR